MVSWIKKNWTLIDIRIKSTRESEVYNLKYIFFAALVVFCQHAWVQGFFHDGYLYASFGKNAAELGKWLVPFQSNAQFPRFDQHPPLVFILEGLFFKLFGSGVTSARLFGALWGVLAVVVTSLFLKRQGNSPWAFFTGMIFILMPSFIKKVRYPNMDVPLTFVFLLSFICYYLAFLRGRKNQNNILPWILAGTFWGVSLLMKGPPGMVILFGVALHLLLTGEFLREIKKPGVWTGLLTGAAVFSIWPLLLYLDGQYDIFESYISKQVFNTMVDSRGTDREYDLFAYLVHLVKYSPLWMLLAVLGLVQFTRNGNKDPLYLLFLSWFLGILIPFSLMHWKYSHYIIPIYPAFAALAAYPLCRPLFVNQQRISYIFRNLLLAGTLIVLIFPLTIESNRDRELTQVANLLEKIPHPPKTWIVVGDVYDYWAMGPFSSYLYGADPYAKSIVDFEEYLKEISDQRKDAVILISRKSFLDLKSKNPQKIEERFHPLIYFPKKDMIVLLERFLHEDFLISE